MKLDFYLHNFSEHEQDIIREMIQGMNYNYQLLLVSQLKADWLPQDKSQALRANRLLSPLSDRKKISFILDFNFHFFSLAAVPSLSYYLAVKKMARKNKVSCVEDLLQVHYKHEALNREPVSYTYPKELEDILSLDGREFEVEGKTYKFYLPKLSKEFKEAGQELGTCVGGYAAAHLNSLFKFFVRLEDKYFCSVQIVTTYGVVTYAKMNYKPSEIIQEKMNESLAPFLPRLEEIARTLSERSKAAKEKAA